MRRSLFDEIIREHENHREVLPCDRYSKFPGQLGWLNAVSLNVSQTSVFRLINPRTSLSLLIPRVMKSLRPLLPLLWVVQRLRRRAVSRVVCAGAIVSVVTYLCSSSRLLILYDIMVGIRWVSCEWLRQWRVLLPAWAKVVWISLLQGVLLIVHKGAISFGFGFYHAFYTSTRWLVCTTCLPYVFKF